MHRVGISFVFWADMIAHFMAFLRSIGVSGGWAYVDPYQGTEYASNMAPKYESSGTMEKYSRSLDEMSNGDANSSVVVLKASWRALVSLGSYTPCFVVFLSCWFRFDAEIRLRRCVIWFNRVS
jgi:hypothetical protein